MTRKWGIQSGNMKRPIILGTGPKIKKLSDNIQKETFKEIERECVCRKINHAFKIDFVTIKNR